MSQVLQSYGAISELVTTNLQTLSSSSTAIWQSTMISASTLKAIDYKVFVRLPVNNTAPANDKAMYVFVCPFTHSGGAVYFPTDIGTTTLPTGAEGTATINSSSVLKMLGVLNYVTANQTVQDSWFAGNAFGSSMPDGFSVLIENFSGATLSSACVVAVQPISQTVA